MVSPFSQEHAVSHRTKSRIFPQEETATGTRLPKSSKRLGNLENLSSAFSQDFGSDNELLRSSLKGLGVQAYGHQKPPLSAFEPGPVRRSESFSFVAQ